MKTNQWLRPFLFTLVVIVAPIITYYIYSVESRETFLLERFHAHLANSAGRIEGRFSSAFDVMRHNRRGNEELGLAIEPDDCGDPQDTKGGQEAAEIKSVSRTSERALALTYWDCAATANTIALVGQVDVERQFDEVVILDDKNAVVFQRDPEDGRIASGQLLVERADSDSESKSAISDPFADMRVSYQGQTFLVFSQPLVVSDETGAPGVTAPPNQPGAPSNGTSKASADSEPETNSSSKASAAAARPVPASWQIVGLVEEGQFNSLKYSVSTSNLALVALLVLTALFGGPFLKLWYLGRFEPLTRFDILFMIGGGLCLVATGTVTLLAWDTSTLVSGYLDSRLETVSKALRVAIDKEFDEAVDALHALEPAMVAAYTQRNVEAGTSTIKECKVLAEAHGSAPTDVSAAGGSVVTGDVLFRLNAMPEVAAYRQLGMAYLMDENGCQIVKWASAATWTKAGRFEDRAYFLRALPDERVPLDLYKLHDPEREYFQQAIVSRTTGEREVAFSKPVFEREHPSRRDCADAVSRRDRRKAALERGLPLDPDPESDRVPAPCVSVLTAKFWALDTVLPYGYGAMLLDGESNVLLRAAGDESTERNLASEVDAGEQIRTAVRLMARRDPAMHEASGSADAGSAEGGNAEAGNADDVEPALLFTDYHMNPHRFLVAPLAVGGDLALVVFYDRNLVLTAVFEAVGAAVVAWLIWASILVTLFLALWIVDDLAERTLRHWPVVMIGVLALVALAWSVAAIRNDFLWTAAGIPLLLVASLALTREGPLRLPAHTRRVVMTAAIWGAVMFAAAWPMKVFYGDAELQTLGALRSVAAEEFDRAEAAQQMRFDAWKHRVRLGGETDWVSSEVWSNLGLFEGEQAESLDSGPCGLNLVCLILQNVPDYTDAVSRVHAVYRAGMPESAEPLAIKSFFAEPAEESEDQDEEEAALPDLTELLRAAAWFFFLWGTAVAIWYLLMRTFGLRAENNVEVSPFSMPDGSKEAHYMVYGVPQARKKSYHERFLQGWVDLRTASSAPNGIPLSDAVVLDEFDCRLNDIGVVRERVELLERLLRADCRIILLFVNTDPLNFVTATYDAEKHGVLLARFALALSRFKLVYPGTAAKPSSFWDAIVNTWRSTKGRIEKEGIAKEVKGIWDGIRARIQKALKRPDWRRDAIKRECRHPDLWEIRDDLTERAVDKQWTNGQIIQQVHSRANAIYQRWWSQCTRVEKFTLIELARGNPMNPNNWDAARRLAVRRYVVDDPFYRIGSESLRQFVGRMALTEDVKSWNAASPGAWNQIKVPLLVLFIGVIVFIGVTQPGLFNATVAFVAAGAASLPFLANALSARLQRVATGDK